MPAHDCNSQHYDYIFQKRFGSNYNTFTNSSMQAIQGFGSNLNILDFGCGTGRLSIPLTQIGHKVFSVDICQGMLEVLHEKAGQLNLNITTALSLDDVHEHEFDLVLSVFTVNNYITDSAELEKTFRSIFNLLKPGGLFFFYLSKRDL